MQKMSKATLGQQNDLEKLGRRQPNDVTDDCAGLVQPFGEMPPLPVATLFEPHLRLHHPQTSATQFGNLLPRTARDPQSTAAGGEFKSNPRLHLRLGMVAAEPFDPA